MKLTGITFKPELEVEFTREEVEALIRGAETHYDARCRSTAMRPDNDRVRDFPETGLLLGLRNHLALGEATASYSFTSSELDLLAKVAESPLVPRAIFRALFDLLKRAGAERTKADAATEILEALRALVEEYLAVGGPIITRDLGAVTRAQAAIAKAEGP